MLPSRTSRKRGVSCRVTFIAKSRTRCCKPSDAAEITETLSSSALREILALPFDVEMPDAQRALALARKHGLTCYAAFYLTLALQLDRPLATIDTALAAAARKAKILWTA